VTTLDDDMTAAFSIEAIAAVKAAIMMALYDDGFSVCRCAHCHTED
jgi:hypothetical protein